MTIPDGFRFTRATIADDGASVKRYARGLSERLFVVTFPDGRTGTGETETEARADAR